MTIAVSTELPIPKGWSKRLQIALLHVVGLGRFAMTHSQGWAAHSPSRALRLRAELDRALATVARLEAEMAIKDRRMTRLEARRRPQYEPADRLEILLLRAAQGWTLAHTARRFLVEPATIRAWMRRLDEGGPEALVQVPVPVNRFSAFVAETVRHLRSVSPALGKRRSPRSWHGPGCIWPQARSGGC